MFHYFRPAEKRFPTGLRLLDKCEVILTNERALLQIVTNQVMVVHDTEYVGDWPVNWWKAKGEHRCVLCYLEARVNHLVSVFIGTRPEKPEI